MIQELMATIKQLIRRVSVLESQIELPDMAGFLAIDGSNANTAIDIQGQNLVNVGNLGVGIAIPEKKLHVYSTVNDDGLKISAARIGQIIFESRETTPTAYRFQYRSGTVNTFKIVDDTNAVDRLSFTSGTGVQNAYFENVKLGLSTNNPLAKFHSKGTANEIQQIIQANATQTPNILEIQDSVGTRKTYVKPNYGLVTGGDRVKSNETSVTTATVSDDVELHFCNGAGAYALTLPAQVAGKTVRIINKNTGVVTLTPASGLISGAATKALNQYDSLLITSDGTNWY